MKRIKFKLPQSSYEILEDFARAHGLTLSQTISHLIQFESRNTHAPEQSIKVCISLVEEVKDILDNLCRKHQLTKPAYLLQMISRRCKKK